MVLTNKVFGMGLASRSRSTHGFGHWPALSSALSVNTSTNNHRSTRLGTQKELGFDIQRTNGEPCSRGANIADRCLRHDHHHTFNSALGPADAIHISTLLGQQIVVA